MRAGLRFALLSVTCVTLGAACAPTLTSMKPAQTVGKGGLSLGGGVAVAVPVGPLAQAVEDGADAAKRIADARASGDTSGVSKQDVADAMRAAGTGVLSLPSVAPVVAATYGFAPTWEGTLRWGANGTSLSVRNQVLDSDKQGVDGTWGLAVGRATFEFPIPEVEPITLEDYARYEAEASFLIGWSSWLGHLWLGPKVIATSYSASASVDIKESCSPDADLAGSAIYGVGTLGFALGLKYLFVGVELAGGYVSSQADLTGDMQCDEIDTNGELDEALDSSGVVLGAEAALFFRF